MPNPAPLQTEFAFEALVECAEALDLGASPVGARKLIPIVGGTFEGPRTKGTVLFGGGDWQLVRADGVLEVDARYTIRTDDGALISVRNRGIVAKLGTERYVRSVPTFEAPAGSAHEWLNKAIFVGTIDVANRAPLVARIAVFKVV
jgi:Protein of unknown function (DUF3237)